MKNNAIVLLVITTIFILASCSDYKYEGTVYTYNGYAYTDLCEYGNLRSFYDIRTAEAEIITVKSEYGEQKAKKISGDIGDNFFLIHDVLYVKQDFELPTVQKNNKDISYIVFDFFEKGTVKIIEKDDIAKLVEIILEADSKQEFVKDINFEYIANVDVQFGELPVYLRAGKIVANQSGEMFYSSFINPKGMNETEKISWYSVPLNKQKNKTGDGSLIDKNQ